MPARVDQLRLLRYAGLFTWAVIALPLLMLLRNSLSGRAAFAEGVTGWEPWLAWIVFGPSYAWLTRKLGQRTANPLDYLLLLVLVASAIATSYFTTSGLGSILLMVMACVLPWLLPLGVSIVALIASELAVVPVYMWGLELSFAEALMQAALYVGVTGFVFATSLVARQQAQAREEQRRLNSELRATRALLAESVRVNERTRIARELHDLLGHHLTALSLNLEVAGHLTHGPAQEHEGQAHTLAKLLLSDVREAVSQLRDGEAIDLAAVLRPLALNVPGLSVNMQLPEPFWLDDPERVHVLLRCTQEIITNTVRHAQARQLWLDYRVQDQELLFTARDDGRGADRVAAGNGLRGMQERLASHGGRIQTSTAPGAGFALEIRLPLSPSRTPAHAAATSSVANASSFESQSAKETP